MPLARNAASSTGVHKPDFLNMLLNYLVVPYLARSDWHIAEYYLVLSRDAAQASAAFSLGCLPSLSHFFLWYVLHQRLLVRLILGGRLGIGLGAEIENPFYLSEGVIGEGKLGQHQLWNQDSGTHTDNSKHFHSRILPQVRYISGPALRKAPDEQCCSREPREQHRASVS